MSPESVTVLSLPSNVFLLWNSSLETMDRLLLCDECSTDISMWLVMDRSLFADQYLVGWLRFKQQDQLWTTNLLEVPTWHELQKILIMWEYQFFRVFVAPLGGKLQLWVLAIACYSKTVSIGQRKTLDSYTRGLFTVLKFLVLFCFFLREWH